VTELLNFLGHYWWLAFPVFGMTMGAVNARVKHREVTARRRHREQLELIRAQGGSAAMAPASSVALPAPSDGQQRVVAAQDAVTHRWLEYELDATKLISYPAMSDGRQPLTAAFLRAKKVATDQAATPNERQLAYKRVREELDGLILLSDEAVDVLEKKVALELPRGATAPPAATAPGSAG